MRKLRWSVLVCLLVGQTGCGGCTSTEQHTTPKDHPRNTTPKKPEATNKEKILGVWEVTKSEMGPKGATLEFTKDGKMKVTAQVEGKPTTMEGKYTMEGDTITVMLLDKDGKPLKGRDGKEMKNSASIVKLTDKEMVTKDEKGQIEECKKK